MLLDSTVALSPTAVSHSTAFALCGSQQAGDLGRDSVHWCPVCYERGAGTSPETAHCLLWALLNHIGTLDVWVFH